MGYKVFCWLFLVCFVACCEQTISAQLYFDRLTINEGLSHNTVYCVLQDSDGYIWVGTRSGLNKYDGYSIEIYRSSDAVDSDSGFLGTHISALLEDREGNLWVGTHGRGLNYKKRFSDRFVSLRADSAFVGLLDFEISSIFEDQEGHIWLTTVGAGVLKYNPQTGASQVLNEENSNLSSNVAFDVLEDKYGTIWVATAGGGLNYLEASGQFVLSHEMLPGEPNMSGYRKTMLLDDEYLWLGTQGTGLYRMNIKDRSFVHFAEEDAKLLIGSMAVMDLHKSENGRILIATDGDGLYVYDPINEKLSVAQYTAGEKNTINSNSLLCLHEDQTGNVWIGTYNNGLNIYKPNKTWFEFISSPLDQSTTDQYRSILSIHHERESQEIWVGTDGGGLLLMNQSGEGAGTAVFRHRSEDPESIAGNVVKTIFQDDNDRLWLGMFGAGLDLYDPLTKSFRHVLPWNPNVWSIAQRPDGELLVATMGSGVTQVNPETFQISPFNAQSDQENNLGDPNIMTVFVDQSGRTWIGSAERGLDILNIDNQHLWYCQYQPDDSLSISDNAIRTIYEDSDGDIWIGTEGGGLNRWLGNGQFARFTEAQGLIANSVIGITEDRTGALWITTFEGISRLNKTTQVFRNFDFRTAKVANQFNQEAILTSSSGKLYFGGTHGLVAIKPEMVKSNQQRARILFTDLKLYDQSVPVGELPDGRTILTQPIESSADIWLSYADQSFSLDFTLVDYTNPQETAFSYKLVGFNTNWQTTATGQRSVTYTNLDPGTYTFVIKHQEQSKSINIHVKPPYWQTLWFKSLLSIGLLALVIASLYFWNRRREAAHKREVLQLQNEKLAIEVEAKNAKLLYSSVQMAHKNEIITEVKKDLHSLPQTAEQNIRALIRKIDHELFSEDYWKEFNLYFNEVDKQFIDKLNRKHPELTQNDIRMSSLLRLNLSTKEIASLLNISTRAVEQGRYRLKKRLHLSKEEDLVKYIISL